jgi:transcriptional regulator with PAS, ATPase and Fis domain
MDTEKMLKELHVAVTVCDSEGIILFMNDRAGETFGKYGGRELLGSNVLDCHPEPSRSKLAGMLQSGHSHCYTIEKKGVKKLIYQGPWHEDGVNKGFVELSIVMPDTMPHYVRA